MLKKSVQKATDLFTSASHSERSFFSTNNPKFGERFWPKGIVHFFLIREIIFLLQANRPKLRPATGFNEHYIGHPVV